MRYLLIIAVLFGGLSLAGLSACNTTKGFGEDVEDTGEWIQDKAEDAEE